MKTVKNLYPQIIEFKNLYAAFKKASKGKRWKPYVEQFKVNLEKELFQLQEDLISKTYQPGEYYNFYITLPKRRLVSAAPFRDRVVHHAICSILEPIYEELNEWTKLFFDMIIFDADEDAVDMPSMIMSMPFF